MRIHIIGINYWPEVTGIAPFTTGRAEYLASRGHEVTICTGVPYYPEWRVSPNYRRFLFDRECRAGVTILRCPIYVPSKVTPLRRVIHEATFILSALLRSLFCRRPDVVYVVSPPIGLGVAAWFLRRVWWRVPYVLDVEDLQPDTALNLGMMKRGLMTRALYGLERFAYRHAALVLTLTDAMRARIVSKGIAAAKVMVSAAWAEPELFALAPDDGRVRQELGLGDRHLVVHAGNMGVKQGLDVVLESARLTSERTDILYLLVGDGAMRPALEAKLEALGLTNVRMLPLVARDTFLRLLAAAEVCLVTQQRTVADVVFPSKVVTLLAAGRPVIASVSSESAVARAIVDAGAGVVVAPEDPSALAAAVTTLIAEPATRNRMTADGRAYARARWSRDTILAELERAIVRAAAGLGGDVAAAEAHPSSIG